MKRLKLEGNEYWIEYMSLIWNRMLAANCHLTHSVVLMGFLFKTDIQNY